MYYISKRIEISAAHRLDLPYESKCSSVHGHNWIVTVHCRAEFLNAAVQSYRREHSPVDMR